MSKIVEEVKGTVEAVGTKFNGSAMVNGSWYNLKKGVKMPENVKGKEVVLTLEPWEFQGKSGKNVSAINVLEAAKKSEEPKYVTTTNAIITRDYDKENHGKVKSLFLEALLSNPSMTTDMASVEFLNSKALQDELDKLVESVF